MHKFVSFILIFHSLLFIMSCTQNEGSQGKDFTDNVNKVSEEIQDNSDMLSFFEKERNPIAPKFVALPTGDNRPKGWLLERMKNDLKHGMVGALDELYPGIKADDLYRTARRGGMEDIPEMGDLVLTGADWETSIMWWNAETIGNWWDGFVRHAFLTEEEAAIAQSRGIVENLLASQDEDGYIGIYKENLRYQHEGSNGELWAQTTAFRMLLAYYEITEDSRVLEAVEKAMAVTMANYNEGVRNPFDLKNAFGGVTHGLMMTDVCETLFRITGNTDYQKYATYLYKAFSTFNINRAFNDVRYPFLVKKEEPFTGHGVHTYEHLRTLLFAYHSTGYEELSKAYENALHKLDQCILPSGAGHAMEWIAGMTADPSSTATEFCTMLELRNFYGTAGLKFGDVAYADRAEKLTFNGMQGAVNKEGSALAYGIADNCFKMDGKSLDGHEDETRYKFSPTHSEPAVCCVPNYTRNYSYYLDQMWGKTTDGLAAMMYAPSLLKTKMGGQEIEIEQITNYPHSDAIEFKISLEEPKEFSLYFRKPSWSKNIQIEGGEASFENGFYQVRKIWENGDVIQLKFVNEVQPVEFSNGEIYFQRGPIVYALEIPHERENIKDYSLQDFHDYYCKPSNTNFEALQLDTNKLDFAFSDGKNLNLSGSFLNEKTGEIQQLVLKPMGSTVLRRVSFPVR